jgi:hypothetical protein
VPMTFTSPNAAAMPTSMRDLDPPERLIVWTFRRWALGLRQNNAEHWSFVWFEFTKQFGARGGREALSEFACLIKGLQCYTRRALQHHQPCCPCLAADEVALVALVAACQSRQANRARALAEWLVLPDGAGELLAAATRLARVMGRHALTLPIRSNPAPAHAMRHDQAQSRITVH